MFKCEPVPFENDTRTWPKSLCRDPGVYEIILLNKDGDLQPLPRICGVDPRGILYIGRQKALRNRLTAIRRHLFRPDKGNGPMPVLTYCASQCMQKLAPARQLAFRFKHCVDYLDEEKVLEKHLLRQYFRKFGEVPPLNGRAEFITTL